MEADWDEVHRITIPPPRTDELPTPATAIAFDTQQELLWIGNEYGRVQSFYGAELQLYTSYRAHPLSNGPVKQLLFHERGVISVAPTSVHLSSRRGLTQWHIEDTTMTDLRCMSYMGRTHSVIVVGGCQTTLLKIDVERGTIIENIPSKHEYTMMKRSHWLCAATSTGPINILDPDNLNIIQTLNTNNVGICDMDARNNYLVTCGWVTRPQGTPMLASLANVYDLKAMVQLAPIAFQAGAAHVQMHPRLQSTCLIASQSGQLQVVDLMNTASMQLRHADISGYLSSLVLSPSGEALALCDADGLVHLWGSPSKLHFADFSNPTEFADPEASVTVIEVNSDLPLSAIGMPYYREQLLSSWSTNELYEVGNLPTRIDPLILENLRTNEVGAFARNPKKTKRNQVEKSRFIEGNAANLGAPKFLSEKARHSEPPNFVERRISDVVESLAASALAGTAKAEIPAMYRNVEIKYSKFGVDDFDFEYVQLSGASNFGAAKMGLLEEHSTNGPLTSTLQTACRYLLEHISNDYRKISPHAAEFDQTFAIDAYLNIRCPNCFNDSSHHSRARNQIPTFSQILKVSMEGESPPRGWCDKCRRYHHLSQRKTIRGLPNVLILNAALKSAEAKQYWAIPGWLPDRIGIIVDNGKPFCFEGEDLRLHLQRRLHIINVYDLVGTVADVSPDELQKSHLVSMINVAVSEKQPQHPNDWHLFNDFLVRKISKDEALRFIPAWKNPAIVTYQVSTASHRVDDSWKDSLDTSLLYHNWSINNRHSQDTITLRPDADRPTTGFHVAIDTEFVALQQEEIDISANGDREVVRPTRLGLARVSVLRGSNPDEGVPFINDYIVINEPIVDYLTKWSGVEEGDLTPRTSLHNLVPLKVAYKKLWLLLNLGCIFIGHGLPKDFRTINIQIPKAQVLDTVDLFFSKARQRKLSLRYLAWYLLKEDIQTENHDSIEDARTALKLWRKWEEFTERGIEESMIEEVYRAGKKWGYKPPGEGGGIVSGGPEVRREGHGNSAGMSASGGNLTVPANQIGGRETPDILRGGSDIGTPGRTRGNSG
ncbi:poly(A)-specific ribonuclease [Agyrium rufum]|nr:poly(A)-specific ribonuclease [Agyrium rufum]